MSIVRIEKNKRRRYTVVSNTPINCPEIDWPELGLLTYLMSKPDGWDVSIKHLTKQKPSGESRVKSLLKKLQKHGYAEWRRFNDGTTEWTIYEEPKVENQLEESNHISAKGENPHVENPQEGNPHVENHPDIVKTQPLVKTENKVKTQGALSLFEQFWSAYPRKENKKRAGEVWKTKKLDRIGDQIIADVKKRSATHKQWIEGIIPHASTYLNGERWTDDIVGDNVAHRTHQPESYEIPQFDEAWAEIKRRGKDPGYTITNPFTQNLWANFNGAYAQCKDQIRNGEDTRQLARDVYKKEVERAAA
tara:strand:+ start:188 stop:1102 length:915 start_codon:yes stop_codon:yes gene_type:complete